MNRKSPRPKLFRNYWFVTAVLIFLSSVTILAQQKVQLTIDQIINRIIHENFDIRNARYEILKSDSDYQKFQKKFGYTLSGELSAGHIRVPEEGMGFVMNTKQDNYLLNGGIAKSYDSGTRIGVNLQHNYNKTNTPNFDFSTMSSGGEIMNETYKTTLIISLQQSLAKNCFGYIDKRMEKILRLQSSMQRRALINSMSGLIVQGLVDYWNLLTAQANLETSEIELRNMNDLYAVVIRKNKIGLAQGFEVNQYRSLLYQSQNKVALAKQQLHDAKIKMLKNLNMDQNLEIDSVTQLYSGKPNADFNQSLNNAYQKRVDLKNAVLAIQIAKYQFEIAENGQLPDVSLFANAASADQATDMAGSLEQFPTYAYPQLTAGIKATYVLDDPETKTNLRDAEYGLKQARLQVMQLKKDIRDEINSLTKKSQITYDIYHNTREAEIQALSYYRSIRAEVNRGRFSALALKEALDNYIRSRYATTGSLVQYNVTLLQLDLAQNRIFERFGLDPEKILTSDSWREKEKQLEKSLREENK